LSNAGGTMFNSVYVAIRLHYLNPVSGEWSYHDGVGSAQIKLKRVLVLQIKYK
jgi:hypothetical protein